jgi:uncharacterized membrane protein YbaN (DUF454 family)
MPLLLGVLGILGITLDLIFLLAFFMVLAYYLYRIEKRLSTMEGSAAGQQPDPNREQRPR